MESQGAVPGIQIAHAGRKASCDVPWRGGRRLTESEGGWAVIAPSAIPFNPTDPAPIVLDQAGIDGIVASFEAAAGRALEAEFKVVEIHAAHGYLLHEFPLPARQFRAAMPMAAAWRTACGCPHASPKRSGPASRAGSRFLCAFPPPDWVKSGWDIEQSIELARRAKERGIDLIDVSLGALVPDAKVPVGKGFRVPFAKRIRAEAKIKTAAVGMITDVAQADEIVMEGDAGLVMIGRELLRQLYFALRAQAEIGAKPSWPVQYGYAVQPSGK